MHYRRYAIRVDAGTARRLMRLQRGTGTPVRKLVTSVLNDYLDSCPSRMAQCSRRRR